MAVYSVCSFLTCSVYSNSLPTDFLTNSLILLVLLCKIHLRICSARLAPIQDTLHLTVRGFAHQDDVLKRDFAMKYCDEAVEVIEAVLWRHRPNVVFLTHANQMQEINNFSLRAWVGFATATHGQCGVAKNVQQKECLEVFE